MNKNLRKFAKEVYEGKVTLLPNASGEKVDANDVLRNAILDVVGGEWNFKSARSHKIELFELIEEVLTEKTTELTRETFSPIAVYKDTAFGDKLNFVIDNTDLFDVSVIANGTDNLYRQRIVNGKLPITTFKLGVKIYEDWDAFMCRRIDFAPLIDRVARSFENKIVKIFARTFSEAYDSLGAGEYKIEGAFKEDDLLELIAKVGSGAVIYGSKTALRKLPNRDYVEDYKDLRNQGYVSMWNGVQCVEIENAYDEKTKKFIMPQDTLFIVPEGEKIIYFGFEGDAIISDNTDAGRRGDMQLEYLLERNAYIGIKAANRFGAYKITK